MSTEATQREADAVVIGGGIVGSATAYYLAKRGAKVVLLEKGSIGNEQSSRAWGFVRQQGRDLAELPLMIESNKSWPGLCRELETDIEWVQGGNLRLARDDEQLAQYEDWLASTRGLDLDTRMVSPTEIKELIPDMATPPLGGMYTPSDGHAEPLKVAPAFARAAASLGAEVYTDCPAQGVEVAAGRVTGVITGRGVIKTPAVVCAAGAWSTRIARSVGISLPQASVLSTAAETEPVRAVTTVAGWTPQCAFRQRPNGSFYIAGGGRGDIDLTFDAVRYARQFMPNYVKNRSIFRLRVGRRLLGDVAQSLRGAAAGRRPFLAREGDVEPKPDLDLARRSRDRFTELFPALGPVRLHRVWAGYIDSLPDAVPVLGETGQVQGFILATGFSGHGFAMGPIVGQLMAELIVDGQPSVDIRTLSYERFLTGHIARPKSVV